MLLTSIHFSNKNLKTTNRRLNYCTHEPKKTRIRRKNKFRYLCVCHGNAQWPLGAEEKKKFQFPLFFPRAAAVSSTRTETKKKLNWVINCCCSSYCWFDSSSPPSSSSSLFVSRSGLFNRGRRRRIEKNLRRDYT